MLACAAAFCAGCRRSRARFSAIHSGVRTKGHSDRALCAAGSRHQKRETESKDRDAGRQGICVGCRASLQRHPQGQQALAVTSKPRSASSAPRSESGIRRRAETELSSPAASDIGSICAPSPRLESALVFAVPALHLAEPVARRRVTTPPRAVAPDVQTSASPLRRSVF